MKKLLEIFGEKPGASADSLAAKEDVEKLRKDNIEIREKLVQLRETEVNLKESINELATKLKIAGAIVGVAAAVIAGLGIKQYRDLNDLINKTMQKRMDDALGYYDQVARAVTLVNNGFCNSALPLLREIHEKRPEDEIVFLNAVHCMNLSEDYGSALKFIAGAKAKGLLGKKYQLLLSYNNAGFTTFVSSLSDPSLEDEAFRLIKRAEQIGVSESDSELHFPLANLSFYYLAKGDMKKFSEYSLRYSEVKGAHWDWQSDKSRVWFKRMVQKRPGVLDDLQKAWPTRP